jgi:hypothetical protein
MIGSDDASESFHSARIRRTPDFELACTAIVSYNFYIPIPPRRFFVSPTCFELMTHANLWILQVSEPPILSCMLVTGNLTK